MPHFRFSRWSLLFCLLFASLLIGCERHKEKPLKVSLTRMEKPSSVSPVQQPQGIKIAVSGIISPVETFSLYKQLLDYMSRQLAMPVQFVQRSTYQEVNNLMRDNEIEAAFVCSGAYVDGHAQFGMQALVVPVVDGKTVYYSYIIVPKDSKAASLADLRGRRFAFTDHMSNTGKLAPTYMVRQLGANINSFFSSYIFTRSHDRSIDMVAHGLVDGAAVDSLIWGYISRKHPEITARTKIIGRSKPYGMPPFVVSREIDQGLKTKLRDILLNLDQNPTGRDILRQLAIDKFVPAVDSSYESIRQMSKLQ
jgi:phosphonate transport system substrate-binding protein